MMSNEQREEEEREEVSVSARQIVVVGGRETALQDDSTLSKPGIEGGGEVVVLVGEGGCAEAHGYRRTLTSKNAKSRSHTRGCRQERRAIKHNRTE